MSRPRWMALCFAVGSACFFIGPFPGYAQLVGDSADAVTFFIGSILFTAGGGLQSWLAWAGGVRAGGRAAWWAADRPVRRHPLLQRHDVPGDAHRPVEPGVRRARLATRLARVDLLPRLRRDRLPRLGSSWLVAGARRPRLVAAGSQPARLRLLRNLRCRRLRRSGERIDARPGGGQLEHRRWARRASWRARSTPCTATGPRRCHAADGSASSSDELEADLR